jgi:hypothetical protein
MKSCSNPIYNKMRESAIANPNLRSVEACKNCHDPVTKLDPNYNLLISSKNEGVTCDVCHATRLTKKTGGLWFEMIPQKVKFGPFNDAISNNHKCEFSPIHSQSGFCLTCHDSKSHDYFFGSIEDEWRDSQFSKMDIQCQDCHMPALEGKAALLGKIREEIHTHSFLGGFTGAMLHNCAYLNLDLAKNQNGLAVTVDIMPHSVGHALPTGSTLRMVYAVVEGSDQNGKVVWQNSSADPITEDPKSVFMRYLKDSAGHIPSPPWEAVAVDSDQRLYPGEKRTLTYTISDTSVAFVQATLFYRIAPLQIIKKLGIQDPVYTEPKMITRVIKKAPKI